MYSACSYPLHLWLWGFQCAPAHLLSITRHCAAAHTSLLQPGFLPGRKEEGHQRRFHRSRAGILPAVPWTPTSIISEGRCNGPVTPPLCSACATALTLAAHRTCEQAEHKSKAKLPHKHYALLLIQGNRLFQTLGKCGPGICSLAWSGFC